MRKLTVLLILNVVQIFFLASCESIVSPPVLTPETSTNNQQTGALNVDVQVFPDAVAEQRALSPYIISRNNCGSSTTVEYKPGREEKVIRIMEIGAGIEVSADGKASIPTIGEVQIGAKISGTYNTTYGSEATSREDLTFTIPARTIVEYEVQVIEHWQTGRLEVRGRTMIYTDTYAFRDAFSLIVTPSEFTCPDQIISNNDILQATSSPTQRNITPESSPSQSSATSIPTATPVPPAAQLTAETPAPMADPVLTPTPQLPSILENGQTLEIKGWSLTVSNFTYQTLREVHFSLTNNTGRLVLVPGTFDGRIMANDGSLEAVVCFRTQPGDQFPQREIELGVGATVEWKVDFSDMNAWSECYGPTFYPSTHTLILVISNLGEIFQDVRWQTKIPRP